MNLILGLDFETTGPDPQMDQVIEVGAVLWDIDLRRPVAMHAFLVQTLLTIPEEVQKINGITPELLQAHGIERGEAFARVKDLYESASFVCAHNGTTFDKPFFEKWCETESSKPSQRHWIDTFVDLPVSGGRLTHMAADHGFLNPFPHMACTDVLTMLRILDTYDVKEIIARSLIPNVNVTAVVSYDDREKAKARGYKWKPETRAWIKTVKQTEVEKEVAEAGFRVAVAR